MNGRRTALSGGKLELDSSGWNGEYVKLLIELLLCNHHKFLYLSLWCTQTDTHFVFEQFQLTSVHWQGNA